MSTIALSIIINIFNQDSNLSEKTIHYFLKFYEGFSIVWNPLVSLIVVIGLVILIYKQYCEIEGHEKNIELLENQVAREQALRYQALQNSIVFFEQLQQVRTNYNNLLAVAPPAA